MEGKSIFHGRYRLEKLLGRGAYSEVWLATDIEKKPNTKVALKIFAPSTGLDDNGLDMFAREFDIVKDVDNPYILKPLYFESDRKPYLVLPYCKAGSIKGKVGKISEAEAWQIIYDVAKGLKALHTHKPSIIHQDIKPDNIMIADDGHYMITDFGVSAHLHSTLRKSVSEALSHAGTKAYMASERLDKSRGEPIMASDVWSLGATIFELLMGYAPFGEEGGLLQKGNPSRGIPGVEIPEMKDSYSEKLRRFVERCLSLEPWNRPQIDEILKMEIPHLSGRATQLHNAPSNGSISDGDTETIPEGKISSSVTDLGNSDSFISLLKLYRYQIMAIAIIGFTIGGILAKFVE